MVNTDKNRHERITAGLLVFCMTIVAFWIIMVHISNRSLHPFRITADDFIDFKPDSSHWNINNIPINRNPLEPNILAYLISPKTRYTDKKPIITTQVFIRLVHGYNMPDCMRIKGYKVELIKDTRNKKSFQTENNTPIKEQYQIWRLTSSTDDVSIWITSIIRAGDFRETDIDIRDIAFPKIGTPDDPTWEPHGFTLKSLRHPFRNLKYLIRAKWNNSRSDMATFLGLKQPTWVSDEIFTFIVIYKNISVKPNREKAVINYLLTIKRFMLNEMQTWRSTNIGIPTEVP